MDDQKLEQEINAKGLNAPRLTPDIIKSKIVSEEYHVFPKTMLTVCCLTLQNGFNVIGQSACVSPANFDAEIGRTVAKRNATDQIWPLEGYLLKEKISKA